VSAELLPGYSIDRALAEIKNAVDSITSFPVDAEKPVVNHISLKRNALQLAVSGNVGERALKIHARRIRDEIAGLPGVTQVEVTNAREYEVSIEVPEESLRRHGLTFEQVVAAVRRSSLDLPGGSIRTTSGEILLRSKGQAYRGHDFEEIVIMTHEDGTRLLLADVATVVDGFDDSRSYSRFDGDPMVLIKVYRVGDQKVLELVESVREYLEYAEAQLPEGISVTVWRDETTYLRDRLDILVRNGMSGFVLVFVVLAIFLKLRLAFWVAIGVPLSILGALWLFPIYPLAVDTLTLFAFILVLGLLVDDAIVIGENVHTHQENAEDPLSAAITGTQEVSVPVIFGVLTTVAAFAPMIFAQGFMGQMFGAIGVTVAFCLVFSLIESQLILPSHLGHHISLKKKYVRPGSIQDRWKNLQGTMSGSLTRLAREYYRPALDRVLEWRYAAVSFGVVSLMVVSAVLATGRMEFTFFDKIEGDVITASVELPPGSPIALTATAIDAIEASARALKLQLDEEFDLEGGPVIKHIVAAVGGRAVERGGPPSRRASGDHIGEVAFELISANVRPLGAEELVRRWRALIPPMADVEELKFTYDMMSPGVPINFQLQAADVDMLAEAADELKAQLALYPGVFDIGDSFKDGKEEITLSILPSAEALGLTLEDLARQVRQAFYGEEVQRIQRDDDDVRVMVRYPETERRSLGDLENLRIRTPKGGEVPFYVVAKGEMGRGYSTIRRADRQRIISVTADVDPSQANANKIVSELQAGFLPELQSRRRGLTYGLEGYQREQRKTTQGMVRDLGFALVAIFALLAVPLRSYVQPLIIMAVIPFGLLGAVAGHLILGLQLSMTSVFGVVALSGVVVNSSLVLVHHVNTKRAAGLSVLDAVRSAGVARFRPIALTTMTTFSGLTPLLLERSSGAKFLIPMAASLAFGVVFATLISLFLVPCAYVILEDIRGRLTRGDRDPSDAPGDSDESLHAVEAMNEPTIAAVGN